MTEKQKKFCDFYLETGIGGESAKRAGYKGNSHDSIASENLRKPEIKEYIEKRLKQMESERIAKPQEVLEYLTATMRGENKDQLGLDASLQDRTRAAELLGKRYRLFIEKHEVSEVKPVTIVDDIPESDEDE